MMVGGRQEHGPKADIVTWKLLSVCRFGRHRNSPWDWTMQSDMRSLDIVTTGISPQSLTPEL
jgi:hypothetical protein